MNVTYPPSLLLHNSHTTDRWLPLSLDPHRCQNVFIIRYLRQVWSPRSVVRILTPVVALLVNSTRFPMLSSVNKRASIYNDVTVRIFLRLQISDTALWSTEPKRNTTPTSTSYKDKFVMYPCMQNFWEK